MKHSKIITGLIIMAAVISVGLSPRSEQVLDQWQQRPRETIEAVSSAIKQILTETESYIKANKLSGQSAKVRSGGLRQDVTHDQTDTFGGHVGTTQRTSAYAQTILGPDTTTIRPVKAKHLWVPVADNLTPSRLARFSPREAMELTTPSGKRRLQIFKSKRGNLVAFLPDIDDAGNTSRFRRNTARGRSKGQLKGKLLFVLKDEVTIEGTDALAEGAKEMIPRMTEIFNNKLEAVGS